MLNKKTVALELYRFSVVNSINVNILKDEITGEEKWEYLDFLFADLLEEGFDDNDFLVAIKTIKRENPNLYGKMPNFAMFIKARPKKQESGAEWRAKLGGVTKIEDLRKKEEKKLDTTKAEEFYKKHSYVEKKKPKATFKTKPKQVNAILSDTLMNIAKNQKGNLINQLEETK